MIDIDNLLASYPRDRPDLSPEHQRLYRYEYKAALEGVTFVSAMSRRAEGWMHRRVAIGRGSGATLELGAGSLNHLPYEADVQNLSQYDIVEPQAYLFENHASLSSIRGVYADIDMVPEANHYRRIISVAVLEHLQDLPGAVAWSGLHLEPDGAFQHGIPSEGGALWGAAWRLTTGLSYRLRTGLSYRTLMRHEHINSATEILAVVRHFFKTANIVRFPTPFFHGSLFTHIQATDPKLEACRSFIANRNSSPTSGEDAARIP